MNTDIRPLTQDLLNDYLYFFDNIAFTDNPSWSGCFCFYYHFNGSDGKWCGRTHEENRNAVKELILTGKMKGYLAYIDGKPVGWCNANDRKNYAGLVSNKEIWQEGEEKICSIVCFVISPGHRRKGIAGALLKQICEDNAGYGYDLMEAYPGLCGRSDADQYHGPLDMYKKAGFSIYKELDGYYIVRRKL